MNRFHKPITYAVAALAALAGTFVGLTTGSAASATSEAVQACYEDVTHVEYRHEREVEKSRTEHERTKHTQERTRTWTEGTPAVSGSWWVWSPNNRQGPQDYTPAFPSDDRGTWQGPKTNGGPDGTGTFNTSNGENGRSSWFHREAGTAEVPGSWSEWTAWSEWTYHSQYGQDWVSDPSTDVRGPHGTQTDSYERRWAIHPTGVTREVPDGTETEEGDWQLEADREGWVLVDERTVTTKVEVDCPPVTVVTTEPPVVTTDPPVVTTEPPLPPVTTLPEPPATTTTLLPPPEVPEKPADKVARTAWVDGQYGCADTTVLQTRTVTTTTHALVDNEWVEQPPTSVQQTQRRELLSSERTACPAGTTATTDPTLPSTGSALTYVLVGIAAAALIGGLATVTFIWNSRRKLRFAEVSQDLTS